ncbi:MAG: hypothetical protein H6828_10345 [Planctomycetes bacterium]|nr:hypothetical protein [Planctomycetota bacterium]
MIAGLLLCLSLAAPAERTPAELLGAIRAAGAEVDPALFEELGALQSAEALEALERALDGLPNKDKVCTGYKALRHFAGVDGLEARAVAYLADCARGRDLQLALHAGLRLGDLGAAADGALVELALELERRDQRSLALLHLVEHGMPLDDKQLDKLARSKDPAVAYEGKLARAQREVDPAERERALTALGRSRDAVERLVAVELCASAPGPAAFGVLERALEDKDPCVARKAVASLERLRAKEAVALLVARLASAERGERYGVSRALVRLTGKDLGTEPERWQRWWREEGATAALPAAAATAPVDDAPGGTSTSFYGLPLYAERLVFAMDTSDSMKVPASAGGETRIAIAKREVARALGALPESGAFDVVNFGKAAWSWKGELVPAKPRNVREAQKHVEYLDLSWGTEVYAALFAAFADPRADTIVLLTDGDPQLSVMMDRVAMRRIVRQWNRTRHTTVDCLSIGTERPWLRKLAEESGGRYRTVD